MMALLPLLRRVVTSRLGLGALGVLFALGLLAGVKRAWSHRYDVGYRTGFRAGVSHEGLRRDTIETRARIAVELAQAEASAREAALRNQVAESDRRIAHLAARSALLGDRLATAQARYDSISAAALSSGDSVLSPRERACSDLVVACQLARAALEEENAGLAAAVTQRDSLAAAKDSAATLARARWQQLTREQLAQQRAGFKAPSRMTWAGIGALGAEGLRALLNAVRR